MKAGQLCDRGPVGAWNPALAPSMQTLRCEPKCGANYVPADIGEQAIVGMPFGNHDPLYQRAVYISSAHSLIAYQPLFHHTVGMTFKERFLPAMKAAGYRSVRSFVIKGLGWDPASGPQRMSNYLKGREIERDTLRQIASALGMAPSALVSEVDDGLRDILLHLLKLEGIPAANADTIASAVLEGKRLLESFPDEGELPMRARLAAHAAWQQRHSLEQDT